MKCMFMITTLALIYIHMQMRIFDLAYQGKNKEKQIVELSEAAGLMTCDIQRLKSANHLGSNLLTENTELKFLDRQNIVQIVTAAPVQAANGLRSAAVPERPGTLLSFVTSRFLREARAEEKRTFVRNWP